MPPNIDMKRILTFLLCVVATAFAFAQAPQGMDFQSIIRDSKGNLVTNQAIGLRISILKGGVSGTSVYSETHNATTNNGGLVTVTIGKGTTSDDFSTIDWGNGSYFMKTEVDITGGTNYTLSSTTQMMSVPYALYAGDAGNYSQKIDSIKLMLDSLTIVMHKMDTLTSKEFQLIADNVVTDMTITAPYTIVRIGKDTLQCIATPMPFNYSTITWSSSNNTIATVSNSGVVIPQSVGSVTITAKAGTNIKTITLNVVESIGEFSVSETQKVGFSIGNLQFQPSTGTYKFASNQYETLSLPSLSTTEYNSTSSWIDYLFYSSSWAKKVGEHDPDTYYSLSPDQWTYLLTSRTNASQLQAKGTISGVNGLILLPDNFVCPNGININVGTSTLYTSNSFSVAQWSVLEQSGAIFLPAHGSGTFNTSNGKCKGGSTEDGRYGTTVKDAWGCIYSLSFNTNSTYISHGGTNRDSDNLCTYRLVHSIR